MTIILTPEESRIIKHVVFIGTWLMTLTCSVFILLIMVHGAAGGYNVDDHRLTVLEMKAMEREVSIAQLRAELALVRQRQDEVIWGQQRMYGAGAGMMALVTILAMLTGANWMQIRKSK
jgi:hypothetical protein